MLVRDKIGSKRFILTVSIKNVLSSLSLLPKNPKYRNQYSMVTMVMLKTLMLPDVKLMKVTGLIIYSLLTLQSTRD